MKRYSDLGDPNITSVFKRSGNLTAQNSRSKDATYHNNCYSNVVNEGNLGQRKITTQHLFRQREGDQ